MRHLRHVVGRSTLRAPFLASASFAVAGGLILATAADAAPAVQAAPAFASDRLKATRRVHPVQLAGFAGADALWGREHAALPGVRLVRVDGSRHFIMADQPARFAAVVDQFPADGS